MTGRATAARRRRDKRITEDLIHGAVAPLVVTAVRTRASGERVPCDRRDADRWIVAERGTGRELGQVILSSDGSLHAAIPGRFGIDRVTSVADGARFVARHQPAPRPPWMR